MCTSTEYPLSGSTPKGHTNSLHSVHALHSLGPKSVRRIYSIFAIPILNYSPFLINFNIYLLCTYRVYAYCILTLPHFILISETGCYLPSHHSLSELGEYAFLQWLGKYISHPVLCSYVIDAYSSLLHLFTKMMVLQVQVGLQAGPKFSVWTGLDWIVLVLSLVMAKFFVCNSRFKHFLSQLLQYCPQR